MVDFGNAHPLLIVGIILYVIPFFGHFLPSWFPGVIVSWIGIITLLVGIVLSIIKASS
jgi:hypothetical protein